MTELITPALLLDEAVMQANINRMQARLAAASVTARPHVKTAKSLPVIERMVAGEPKPRLTVSTLREAAEVLAAGYQDVLYAVGMVPQKLPELSRLARESGARVSVILDSAAMADALVSAAAAAIQSEGSFALDAYIELDVDNHRAGVAPDSAELLAIGKILNTGPRNRVGSSPPVSLLRGVMTHAGGSYACLDQAGLAAMAERERAGAVQAASALRDAGMACNEVSIGSTPTALAASSFEGVTEVRVGVYVFNDLVMAGLGVCEREQIAISVLTTVIGHQPRRNTLLIDAGWMALSSDRGTAGHAIDQALGLVVPVDCTARSAGAMTLASGVDTELVVASANQEHGLVVPRSGQPLDFSRYPIGCQLRIWPVHACATAAQYSGYHLLGAAAEEGAAGPRFWSRFGGWTA